jgi:transcriptional regulator NrdR family protein
MVCVYCGSATSVVNSRPQKRANQVWRRRKCQQCQAVFTSIEAIDATQALRLRRKMRFEPFSRDALLLSIYDSLRHRSTATTDATALTTTVLNIVFPLASDAVLERDVLVEATGQILERFDAVAATHYRAFHPTT